jgi:PAS domain S-box-containing protein
MTDKQTGPDKPDSQADGPAQSMRKKAEETVLSIKKHFSESWLPDQTRQLLHELRVFQIELEMQNENLRQTQVELDANRAKYYDLYNLAPVGYLTISEPGLILEANLTASNLLGVERDLLVNQPFTRFITAEDQDVYYLFRKQLFETDKPRPCEVRMARQDGSLFWTRIDATIAKDVKSGEAVCHAVMSDITERKMAEAERSRLAAAVTHAADAVVITDAEGVIEYANPAFEKISGYSLDEVRGKNPRVLKSGLHDREFYEELWKTIKAGQVWRGHVVNRKKDGSMYDEEMTISPIADTSGAIVNFVAVKRDVTREAILQKSRDYFSAITAHELRTPLMKLQLVETMLQQVETAGLAGGQMEKAHSALHESITSFDRIVNAATMISDMTQTGAERQFTRESIYDNVTTALESAQANIVEALRDISIETDMTGLPRHASVMGNGGMIRQALDEALSNAIKYTPDGMAIRVRAYASGGSVHIEVADEGKGIPEDKLGDVFIPYYSLENPLHHSTGRYKFQGGGMGLGLTVAKLIMEYHNGALVIGARTDCAGTLAVLSFPLAGEETPPVAA